MKCVNNSSTIVREKPEERACISDIIRYGTKVTVDEERGPWAHVHYAEEEGWLLLADLLEVAENPEERATAWVGPRGAYLFQEATTIRGPFLHLPFEVPLEVVEELSHRWLIVKLQDGRTAYVQRSQLLFARPRLSLRAMVQWSRQFVGIKYLWGGATSFGYDCSGFVQMLYRQMGITLPRNARQQIRDPQFEKVEQVQGGDLIFFRNASKEVVHVAMMLDEEQMIHAFTKEETWICIHPFADERWSSGYFYAEKEARGMRSFAASAALRSKERASPVLDL